MYYMSHVTAQIRKEDPNVTFAELSRLIGKRWATLKQEDKKPFEVKAVEDYKRWEVEQKKFDEEEEKKKKKEKKKEKEKEKEKESEKESESKSKPAKPTEPPKHPGFGGKSPRPMAIPVPPAPDPQTNKSPAQKSKKRKLPKKEEEETPKKGGSAFVLFKKEKCDSIKQKLRKENSTVLKSDVLKYVEEEWQKLTPAEKERYAKKSQKDRENTKQEKVVHDEKKTKRAKSKRRNK